jgi:muconolactone delta-isomerase
LRFILLPSFDVLDEMDYIEGALAETPLRKSRSTTIDPMTEHDANVRSRPDVLLRGLGVARPVQETPP